MCLPSFVAWPWSKNKDQSRIRRGGQGEAFTITSCMNTVCPAQILARNCTTFCTTLEQQLCCTFSPCQYWPIVGPTSSRSHQFDDQTNHRTGLQDLAKQAFCRFPGFVCISKTPGRVWLAKSAGCIRRNTESQYCMLLVCSPLF